MKTILTGVAACCLSAVSSTLIAAPTVSGPEGLNLTKVYPTEPFFERILTNNRLNLILDITNGTGKLLTYQQGSAVFRDAAGGVVRTAPLSPDEFMWRSKFSNLQDDGAPIFATGGVTTDVGGFTGERIVSAVLDQDNRIVAAGTGRLDGIQVSTILARYTAEGVLDPEFDGDGLMAAGSGYASAVTTDGESNVLVTGTLLSGVGYFIRAYDTEGDSLWTDEHEFSGLSVATALAVDSQGRIVVGGSTLTDGSLRFFLARHLPDGSPDSAFGTGGIVTTDVRVAAHEGLNALAIDSSDRIVAAGWATVGGQNQFAVSRHRASNGSLDTTFSTDGLVLTTFPGYTSAQARALKISPSGRILAGGEVRSGANYRMALSRYDTDGGLDPNLSTDGLVVIDAPIANEYISDIELDVIGRITLTGRAWNESEEKLAIVRLNGIGQLDNSLDGDGILLNGGPEGWISASMRSVMVLPDDDIVVAGYAANDEDDADTRFALARYRPGGLSSVFPLASNALDLLDFPFYSGMDGKDWQDFKAHSGFDSKDTPVSVDLTLQFLEYAEPFVVSGITLAVFEQNPQSYRLPLGAAPAIGWTVNHSRLFDTTHGRSRSQRFAYDFSVRNGINLAVDPECDPDALGLPADYKEIPHPDYVPTTHYDASDFSECYYAYGEPVLGIGQGTVSGIISGYLDNFPVGGNHQPSGNAVTVQYADREYMTCAHLARNSIEDEGVKEGDCVKAGKTLARLGNAGKSGGPHLHVHYTTRLDDDSSQGLPIYFNNAIFPSTEDGLPVRQLRTAIPPFTLFNVDTGAIPYDSIVPLHGPGLVAEIRSHDTLDGPMHLRLPVSVEGSATRATGSSVADAGDTIEDVYRFTVSTAGTLSAQLLWNSGADLDMILYDQNLQPIFPAAAKTLSRPEILCAALAPGTYYLFVSLYDRDPDHLSVSYQLDLGIYSNGRDIYVDKSSTCPTPFGTLICAGDWGGPFPTVIQGNNVVCPVSRMFIRAGTYAESVVFRQPVVVRSYDGTAVINP